MSERFDPSVADGKWQRIWDERQTFRADDASATDDDVLLLRHGRNSSRVRAGEMA